MRSVLFGSAFPGTYNFAGPWRPFGACDIVGIRYIVRIPVHALLTRSGGKIQASPKPRRYSR